MILTLDAAGDGCSAAIVSGGAVLAHRVHPGGRGSAAALPELAREVMREAGVAAPGLRSVAVTVGPGSFTGIRAALALAQGLGFGAGVSVHGVSVPDALRAELEGELDHPLWIVIGSGRERVFLDRDGAVGSLSLSDIPLPGEPLGLAGDLADVVARHLRERGADVPVVHGRGPGPLGIAAGAERAKRDPVPLYVDPVEARPNPAGRPVPA